MLPLSHESHDVSYESPEPLVSEGAPETLAWDIDGIALEDLPRVDASPDEMIAPEDLPPASSYELAPEDDDVPPASSNGRYMPPEQVERLRAKQSEVRQRMRQEARARWR